MFVDSMAMSASATWSAMGESSDRWIIKESSGSDLYVAGYASVDMVDKQGDRIPADALGKAFNKLPFP